MKATVYREYGSPEVLRMEDVAEAHRYVDLDRNKGNVAITVGG